MSLRSAIALTLLLVFTIGCPSTTPEPTPVVQECRFTVISEVDGVAVTGPSGVAETISRNARSVFELPCVPQPFEFNKACYATEQVTLSPGDKHTLPASRWEQHGFLRIENASADDVIEVRRLPETREVPRSYPNDLQSVP